MHDVLDTIIIALLSYCAIIITPILFFLIKERFFEPRISVSEMHDIFYKIIKDREGNSNENNNI